MLFLVMPLVLGDARLCESSKLRHRPLNIEQKGISLYQIVFEEYQKSASYRFFIITFYTLYQKNSESKLHGKVSIEFKGISVNVNYRLLHAPEIRKNYN